MAKNESNILYRRLLRSYFSSVISISLVLFLAGMVGVLVVNARSVSNYFKENITVTAILNVEADEADASGLADELEKTGYIKGVRIVTKEEGVEEMKEEGKLRSIGVSNMTPKLWKRYAPYFATLPAVDQVEFSPYIQQKELRSILDPLGVRLEAWGPIGRGIGHLLDDPTVTAIAERHGKTPAQVVLRFEVQEGVVVLPKSTHTDRMRSNLDIFGFALTESETEAMRNIDKNRGTHDPDAPGVGEALLANFDVHMND